MTHKRFFGIYHKFFVAFIIGGILPMVIIASVVLNKVFMEYKQALLEGYSQSMEYAVSLIESKLEAYDELSKITFYYNSADQTSPVFSYEDPFSLTNILINEKTDSSNEENEQNVYNIEKVRTGEMNKFLRYASLMDSDVIATYFLDRDSNLYGYFPNSFLRPDIPIEQVIPQQGIDKASKNLIIYPTRPNSYFRGQNDMVLTMSRNYYDVSGAVGKSKYVGTFYFDIDLSAIDKIFKNMKAYDEGTILLLDQEGYCLFSNKSEKIGVQVERIDKTQYIDDGKAIIINQILDNGWQVSFELSYNQVFVQLLKLQKLMYIIIGGAISALILSSTLFTNRLVRPIRKIMEQMAYVESGQFDVSIPITTNDEIGVLSRRFNEMSKELNDYINKVYVANLKQKEAELTSLRSQIYPHFLYNTLEVIRMTALDNNDIKVSDMIEALSEQIHYIIGKVDDLVLLKDEINIIEKYIFLLNCRIKGELKLDIDFEVPTDLWIPKLLLQPIVENSYIHGIKPKNGSGRINISVEVSDENVEIYVMDNGLGMTQDEINQINQLLESAEMGIKNEVSWQSIGLKNVYDRIKYLFGEEYGIEVTSTKNTGTLVKIILPKIVKE